MADVKTWIADLARPYTFYSLATASAISIVKMAWGIADGYQAAALAGVVLTGASAIYIGKSAEIASIAKHTTELEKVRAQATPPPATALAPAADTSTDEDPAMYGGPRG